MYCSDLWKLDIDNITHGGVAKRANFETAFWVTFGPETVLFLRTLQLIYLVVRKIAHNQNIKIFQFSNDECRFLATGDFCQVS